jgi:hypothetical protein
MNKSMMPVYNDSGPEELHLGNEPKAEYSLKLSAPHMASLPFFTSSAPGAGFRSLLPAWPQRGGPRVRLPQAMLLLIGCATMATSAQDARPPALEVSSTAAPARAGAVKPPAASGEVRKIDEDQYIVGGVTLRKSTREISFDARVNQTGGLIEFLLVTGKGKIHESLFSCAIRPTDLNVAFKLLGYPSSPELFQILAPDLRPTGKYPEVAEEVKTGARLVISASWKDDGVEKTCTVNDLVKNTATGEVMPPGPWLYTGSLITKTGFRAEATGDIIAVFSNPAAMVNYPGEERTNDEVWSVSQGKLPPKDSPVSITIKPFFKTTQPIKEAQSP